MRGMEITPGREMQFSAANNVPRDLDSGRETEVPQALSLLELIALDSANDRILKNGDVLSVKGRGVSQIAGTDKLKEMYRAFSKNVPKIEKVEENN